MILYEGISEDKIAEKFKREVQAETRYQERFGPTKIDIVFFDGGKRALWIAKYKGEYYGQMMENISHDDKYTAIDVFYALRENAIATLKSLKRAKA